MGVGLSRYIAIALVVAVFGGACASSAGSENVDARLRIMTTVAPITSIVAAVAGDRADIEGLVPEGTNSHTFEPKPRSVEQLARADVLYMNGLQLEEPIKALAEESLDDAADIVELGTRAITPREYIYDFSFPKSGGAPNPHLWTDPSLAAEYAEIVKNDLVKRDPKNASHYRQNTAKFAALVDAFDAAMRAAFATIPSRKLLTYHDAYPYFARTYDWQIIGAIQVSDFEDPTARDVAALVEQVKAAGVPAIFGSEVFPSPVLEQIGREAGVRYVDELRDDDLPGQPGDDEHSWLGLMRFDFITMTKALGGDASALEQFTVRSVAPDRAKYPQ